MTELFSVVLGKVGALGSLALGGVGLTAAFFAAKKLLPKTAGKAVANGLKDGFAHIKAIADPVERQLVMNIAVAVVKWVEYKVPEKGQGRLKFELAAKKLVSVLPFLNGRMEDIVEIIESAVEAMDSELDKAIEK